MHQRSTRHWLALLMVVAGLALAPWTAKGSGLLAGARCNIKGNISFRTGERIYHVPGGKFYDATRINPSKGERWFCSEEEARAAGWRKSLR
jgi:hypothetical protein